MDIFDSAKKGDLNTIISYIKDKGDVNIKNRDGMTILMIAVHNSHIEIVKRLIKIKKYFVFPQTNINARTKEYRPKSEKYLDLVYGWTSLMIATQNGDIEIVRLLLNARADVNARSEEYTNLSYGETALMIAASDGNRDITKLLINFGANVNLKDSAGITALINATVYNHAEIVKLLIDDGADVNAEEINGITALVFADNSSYTEIVKLLKSAGAISYY